MSNYPKLQLYIGGQWKSAPGEPVFNPADESILGEVPHASQDDLDAALEAAAEGFRVWSKTSPAKRADIIMKATSLMRARFEEMAIAMTLEQGKPIAESRAEVLRGCDLIDWDAQEGRRVYGRIVSGDPDMRYSVIRQPIGVVAAFSPWNFPVGAPARKIGGALSAGCAIIIKASEETPAGAFQIAQAFADAGLPPGVLNLIFGKPADISSYLIPHPTVRMVTFTGSIPVGKQLAAMAGAHMKQSVMELGGHGPVIICNDVDAASTAKTSLLGKLRNAGQVCNAPTRFYVDDRLYDRFTEELAAGAAQIKIGNGLDAQSQMGPLANGRRMTAMEEFVADAQSKGARLMAGGKRFGNRGHFFPMTVLADVPDDARVMREEPFGPLILLSRVKNIDEALHKANSLPYGLAGYAFTESAQNAQRIGNELEVGNLAINHFTASTPETPFGGVKDSGFGREGGTEGLQCYTFAKSISHLTH